MNTEQDNAQQILEDLLMQLYQKQAAERANQLQNAQPTGAYLIAQDGQFLGWITSRFQHESLLNPYGPYGSPYSMTSIFNAYSPYGSKYSMYSVHNRYTQTPPQFIVDGKLIGTVSINPYVLNRVPTELFLERLRTDPNRLMRGDVRPD